METMIIIAHTYVNFIEISSSFLIDFFSFSIYKYDTKNRTSTGLRSQHLSHYIKEIFNLVKIGDGDFVYNSLCSTYLTYLIGKKVRKF